MKKYICTICGIEINEKNYNINREAFLNGNSKDRLNYCPFCGAELSYAVPKDKFTGLNFEKDKLDEKTITILDHAAKLEVFNSDFYLETSKLAKSEKVRDMFKALSNIELMHARIHMNLAGLSRLPVLRSMDYNKLKEDSVLLKTASEREKHAVQYYKKYMDEVNCENVRNIMKVLSEIEKQHIELAGKMSLK